jgi:hypothetical protein
MGITRILVEPVGTIDGANTTFTTPGAEAYAAGTLRVLVNGEAHIASDDDGWLETSPPTGVFDLKEPPKTIGLCPDNLLLFYETTDTIPTEKIVITTGICPVISLNTIAVSVSQTTICAAVTNDTVTTALTVSEIETTVGPGTITTTIEEC